MIPRFINFQEFAQEEYMFFEWVMQVGIKHRGEKEGTVTLRLQLLYLLLNLVPNGLVRAH